MKQRVGRTVFDQRGGEKVDRPAEPIRPQAGTAAPKRSARESRRREATGLQVRHGQNSQTIFSDSPAERRDEENRR